MAEIEQASETEHPIEAEAALESHAQFDAAESDQDFQDSGEPLIEGDGTAPAAQTAAADLSAVEDSPAVVDAPALVDDLPAVVDDFRAVIVGLGDYSKQSREQTLSLVRQLADATSFESVVRVQSDYAKNSFASFIAHWLKLNELYSSFARLAFAPISAANPTPPRGKA